ncbi:CLUMA_CG005958, isoform A [Clunio marinus]|uniref:CLUMA_CG005958, isoform A n=1 Tax=Clunio marinus TaxID=568069 RepID=A0A1J1HWD0_9DIPT|nr:CLUMA_CG005958, isoform A [Clunio marinus]
MENYYQFTKKMIFSIGVDFDKQEKYKFLLKILRNISIAFTVLNLIHSLMYFATSNKKDYHNISSVSMTIFGLQKNPKVSRELVPCTNGLSLELQLASSVDNVFCYQLYAGHVIIAIQMIMDQLFLLISAEIKTQFDRLGDRINPKESVNTKKELNEFIDSHNDLISIFNDFNDVYTGAVLFDVVTMAVGICFVGVMTMNLDLAHAIPSALGLILSVGKMFILCWFGNMISESDSAGRIADEVYGSNFLNLNNSLRKDLVIIIQMSQKPRTISVRNVFSLKLSAFSNIIRTAFSYFALAREFF